MQIANESTVLGDFNDVSISIDGVGYLFTKVNSEFIVKVKETSTPSDINVVNDLTQENITLSFDELISDEKLKVFPTLFTNQITIEDLPEKNTVKIFNNTGKLVFDSANEKLNTLNVNHLSKGLYILKVQTETYNLSKKIIKI